MNHRELFTVFWDHRQSFTSVHVHRPLFLPGTPFCASLHLANTFSSTTDSSKDTFTEGTSLTSPIWIRCLSSILPQHLSYSTFHIILLFSGWLAASPISLRTRILSLWDILVHSRCFMVLYILLPLPGVPFCALTMGEFLLNFQDAAQISRLLGNLWIPYLD